MSATLPVARTKSGADIELENKNHGHPGSEFHLSNAQTAEFLHGICGRSRKQPGAVVLGHLSEDCNRPQLPVKEIEAFFGRKNSSVKFKTHVSPRSEPGDVLTLM